MSENYSYDSIGAANASSSALQAGFVNRVFGWMTGGLALTGAMAWAVYNIEPLYKLVLGTPGVFTVLMRYQKLLHRNCLLRCLRSCYLLPEPPPASSASRF